MADGQGNSWRGCCWALRLWVGGLFIVLLVLVGDNKFGFGGDNGFGVGVGVGVEGSVLIPFDFDFTNDMIMEVFVNGTVSPDSSGECAVNRYGWISQWPFGITLPHLMSSFSVVNSTTGVPYLLGPSDQANALRVTDSPLLVPKIIGAPSCVSEVFFLASATDGDKVLQIDINFAYGRPPQTTIITIADWLNAIPAFGEYYTVAEDCQNCLCMTATTNPSYIKNYTLQEYTFPINGACGVITSLQFLSINETAFNSSIDIFAISVLSDPPSSTPSISLSLTPTTSSSPSSSPSISLSQTPSASASTTASTSVSWSISLTRTPSPSPSASTSTTASTSVSWTPSSSSTLSSTLSSSASSSASASKTATRSRTNSVSMSPSTSFSAASSKSKNPSASNSRSKITTPSPTPSSTEVINSQVIEEVAQSSCLEKSSPDCEVESQVITFNSNSSATEQYIPITLAGGLTIGELRIPAFTFQPGCQLMINQSEPTGTKVSKDGCETQVSDEANGSPRLSLTLHNCDETDSKNFNQSIEIQIIAGVMDLDKACLGFTDQGSSQWECLDTQVNTAHNTSSVAVYSAEVNHFTSFAVLFTYSSVSGQCDPDLFYVYLSAAFIGLTVTVFVVVLLLHFNSAFIRLIYGNGREEIEEMRAKISRNSQTRLSNV